MNQITGMFKRLGDSVVSFIKSFGLDSKPQPTEKKTSSWGVDKPYRQYEKPATTEEPEVKK